MGEIAFIAKFHEHARHRKKMLFVGLKGWPTVAPRFAQAASYHSRREARRIAYVQSKRNARDNVAPPEGWPLAHLFVSLKPHRLPDSRLFIFDTAAAEAAPRFNASYVPDVTLSNSWTPTPASTPDLPFVVRRHAYLQRRAACSTI